MSNKFDSEKTWIVSLEEGASLQFQTGGNQCDQMIK